MPNVVLAPHLGSAMVEVREEMANIVVDNILAFLAGKTPPNCVNPEVLRSNDNAEMDAGSKPGHDDLNSECRHVPSR